MDDRELLELAAKAVGIKGHFVEQCPEDGYPRYRCGIGSASQLRGLWNPLSDDSDALRLAVAMRIDIGFHGKDGMYAQSQAHLGECQGAGGEFDCGLDDYALTRRSIVEAAAEIGSLKP